MALKYGWFNAVKTVDPESGDVSFDRTYDSESMNDHFKGLVSQNGVFGNVGTRFQVAAVEGQMKVTVGSGKAMVGNHWAILTATDTLTLDQSELRKKRCDAIILRFDGDLSNRKVQLLVKKGSPVPNDDDKAPPKPDMVGNVNGAFDQTGGPVEMPLAWVYVNANVSGLTASNVLWNVGNNDCPWITHLINGPSQADLDLLLAGYLRAFRDWYSQVTEEMNVNTHMQEYRKVVHCNGNRDIPLDMYGYEYGSGDIFWVQYNGLELIRDEEYVVTESADHLSGTITVTKANMSAGNTLEIRAMKSVIGTPTYIDGDEVRY